MRVAALMLRKVGRKLPVAVLFFLGVPGLYSQTQSVDMPKTGIFSGNVKDISGAPIPDATIAFTSQGNSFTTKTDKEGRYAIEAQPGDYTLKVVASPGFQIYEHRLIHLLGRSSDGENIVLQLSNNDCGVCVIPNPHPVETLNASLASTLPLIPLPPLRLHKPTAR
jgi:Carboxypeptidase regulatory-like domain